jgi:vitamin B12 transporter
MSAPYSALNAGRTCAALLLIGTPALQTLAASEPLEEVTVTATSLEDTVPQQLARYGTRVESLSADVIDKGGFYDVSQALQQLAQGIYVAPLAGAFDYVQLSFQGSRTGDALWLIDGVRINNRLYNTTTPIDTIPSHMLERIEMLEGGQGLFFGTQSVAGAINMVTKSFSQERDARVGVGLDTNDGQHVNGYYRDSFGDHQIVLYGSSDEADGFAPFRDSDFQPSATDRERGYDVQTLGGKYGYQVTEALRLSAFYQHTDAELERPNPKFIASASNERDEDIVSAKLDYTPGDTFSLYLKGYYHDWDSQYNEVDNESSGPEVVSDNEFWGFEDYGLNVLTKLATGGPLEYFLGYDFQRYTGQDDVLLIARQTESVHAPFAQVRTSSAWSEKVMLAAGVRYNSPDNGEDATVWNVSGQWNITPELFVRGTVGTSFRLPDAYELFAIDPCCEIGNPNLEPEEGENLNVSIGGRQEFGDTRFNWELIGFARNVTNLIDIVFDPVLDVDTFGNLDDEVKVRGVEAVAGIAIGDAWNLQGSYTYNDSKADGSDQQLQDIPRSQIKVSLDYDSKQLPFGASLSANRLGDIYRDLGIGRQEYGHYVVVDMNARYYFGADRKHRVGVRLENAFDEEYATRVRQTTPDGGGAPYAYWFVGTPQTWHVSYDYSF